MGGIAAHKHAPSSTSKKVSIMEFELIPTIVIYYFFNILN
jgi:hypothetical protein